MEKKGAEVLITPHQLFLFAPNNQILAVKKLREAKIEDTRWIKKLAKLIKDWKVRWKKRRRGPNHTTPATFLCTKQPNLALKILKKARIEETKKITKIGKNNFFF